MLKEIMDEVLEAEARAEAIVTDALSRAKEIRQKGEDESALMVDAAKKDAAELLASLEKETESVAAEEEQRVLEKGREKTAAVRKDAEGRVTEAAEKVRDRVLEKYGVTAL